MDAAEAAYRVQEQVALLRLRADYHVRRRCRQEDAIDPASFSFCRGVGQKMPELAWAAEAASDFDGTLLSGAWPALGYDWAWAANDPCVWRRAPDTGRLWPLAFFADIPVREGNPIGDVRIAWEPSRLQQLVSLALFARARPGSDEARVAVSLLEGQLDSSVDLNPPWSGIHYASAMECALRIIAISHALDMVRDQLTDPEATWRKALSLVLTHARLISHRLSMHSSSGNHTIAEASGLVYAGVLYPEAMRAAGWLRSGLSILVEQADRQVLADGGGIEQASAYHVFVVELVALVSRLIASRRMEVPVRLKRAEQRGRAFLMGLARTRSGLPCLGDDDNGFALSRHLEVLWVDAPLASAGP